MYKTTVLTVVLCDNEMSFPLNTQAFRAFENNACSKVHKSRTEEVAAERAGLVNTAQQVSCFVLFTLYWYGNLMKD
jgi:hypothetical protein